MKKISSLKRHNILIIDSNESVLSTFRRLLEKNGYQVVTAETSQEAAQKLHDRSFDAALMDIEFPDVEETDFLFQIQNSTPKMIKIIFNSLPKQENRINNDNRSAEVFLEKPVKPIELLMILNEKLKNNY